MSEGWAEMSDLVQRLREPSSVRSWTEADSQRWEAADRIEQLEAASAELLVAIESAENTLSHTFAESEYVDAALGTLRTAIAIAKHGGQV